MTRYVIVWVDGIRSCPHALERMLYDVRMLNGGLYPRIAHVEVVEDERLSVRRR